MNIKQLKQILEENNDKFLRILLPTFDFVPLHFHITEIGKIQKTFIDCGGTLRENVSCLLQVWFATDLDHQLLAGKLSDIMKLAKFFESDEIEVEIEYGVDVASQYKVVDFQTSSTELVLVLAGKQTDCLAKDKCGVSGCC